MMEEWVLVLTQHLTQHLEKTISVLLAPNKPSWPYPIVKPVRTGIEHTTSLAMTRWYAEMSH